MRYTIHIDYKFNDLVILKTEPGVVRQVTKYLVTPGEVLYGLARGADEESWHDASQITLFKDNFVVKGFHQKPIYAKKS